MLKSVILFDWRIASLCYTDFMSVTGSLTFLIIITALPKKTAVIKKRRRCRKVGVKEKGETRGGKEKEGSAFRGSY